ncbi:MAG: zinc ribbon domain-containing protein [Clostridiales bacterium]|nr:zinc ribbon domain-containing protein [Clostridiales bacterium]
MAFFDKLGEIAKNVGDKTTEFAKNVGEKTGDLIEINRLNAKVAVETNAMNEHLHSLGALYWSKFQAGDPLPADAVALCNAIQASAKTIEDLKAEITAIRETADEADAPGDSAPAAPPAADPPAPGADLTCPACGTVSPAGTRFCGSCGTKL